MSKIILQPSGNKDSREHYKDTIENSISLQSIRSHISNPDFEILKSIYPSGFCKVWGVTPGGNNLTKWNRIETGDVTLFSRNGGIYASAVTTHKLHSRSLAIDLWDFNNKGQTWEYIYFLEEVKNHNIPYIDFNRAVGYADNYVIQGFNVLKPSQSISVLKTFDLESEIFIEEITEDTYKEITLKLDTLNETESEYQTKRRLEQGYLKSLLFGKNTIGKCACCKKEFPVSFLVTAHIKKRSFCTKLEKLDPNIVMPMCKLGCDEIYEKGYISVVNRQFINMNKTPISDSLNEYIKSIENNECEYFSNDTKKYFDWHLNHHK